MPAAALVGATDFPTQSIGSGAVTLKEATLLTTGCTPLQEIDAVLEMFAPSVASGLTVTWNVATWGILLTASVGRFQVTVFVTPL